MLAMLDRGDLTERMNGEIALALHLVVGDDFSLVRLTDFLEHPADDPPARLRVGVENEVGHLLFSFHTSPPCKGGAGVGCFRGGSMPARKLIHRHRAGSFATHPFIPSLVGR